MSKANSSLNKAKIVKNDEFYTLMSDIENELSKYDFTQFNDKIVYCNCDDPTWSNFFKFFTRWGKRMGIKEVHFTKYANGKGKKLCPHCQKEFTFDEFEIDHITPLSKGGRTELKNAQLLCKRCNVLKGGK